MSLANQNLFEILELSDRMLQVARQGTENRHDAECGIVFATLHDYGLHMRKLATRELRRHKAEGWFDAEDEAVLSSARINL